jgi:hypothetical protein
VKGTFAFGFIGKNDCAISVALPALAHFDPGNRPGVTRAIGLGDPNLEIVKVLVFGKLLHAPVMDVYFRPSNLMIRPFLICYWPHDLFTQTEFCVNPDFRSNHTYLIPSVILGRFLTPAKNMTLTASPDVPVDRYTRTHSEQFKLKVAVNYFFP